MTQVSERQQVLERMRKILARTEQAGCTEAEALTAMAIFEKLSQTYDISMSEVDVREEPCVKMMIDTGTKKRGQMDYIMVKIASLCSLRYWVSDGGKNSPVNLQFNLFGQRSDLDRARYYYDLISAAMHTETEKYVEQVSNGGRMMRGQKRTLRCNFQEGFRARMNHRLTEMKAKRDEEIIKMQATGTSLVVVKEQVVEEAFANLGMNLRSGPKYYHKKQYHNSANTAGWNAAGTVHLNDAVEPTGRNKLLLS